MKTLNYLFIFLFSILAACKPVEQSSCYPVRIKITTLTGGTSALIQDYKYSETNLLKSTVRSDYQTFYYTFNDQNKLSKIERKNVQTLRKLESQYVYEDELPIKVNQYEMRLDPYTQADKDTSYIGFNEYKYDGNKVMSESVYSIEEKTNELILDSYYEFKYNGNGNMSMMVQLESPVGDTISAYSYEYDNGKHPLYGINLGFDRESHINNIYSKTDLLSGTIYRYEIRHNASNYADQINIREEYPNGGNSLIEILNIEYDCQ